MGRYWLKSIFFWKYKGNMLNFSLFVVLFYVLVLLFAVQSYPHLHYGKIFHSWSRSDLIHHRISSVRILWLVIAFNKLYMYKTIINCLISRVLENWSSKISQVLPLVAKHKARFCRRKYKDLNTVFRRVVIFLKKLSFAFKPSLKCPGAIFLRTFASINGRWRRRRRQMNIREQVWSDGGLWNWRAIARPL